MRRLLLLWQQHCGLLSDPTLLLRRVGRTHQRARQSRGFNLNAEALEQQIGTLRLAVAALRSKQYGKLESVKHTI